MRGDCNDVLERMIADITAEQRPDESLGCLLTAGNRLLQYHLAVEEEGCESIDSECPWP
jgi:hypothetical protein